MTNELFDLTGKTALITGGSRGLGRQMALAFARAGADIVVASRKLDSCEATAHEIESLGRKALPYACHVADWDGLDGLVDAAFAEFGAIDILVNNAGMSPLAPSSNETPEELYDKVMGVNLKGPFRLTALVAPRMREGQGGSVINISSIAAARPEAMTAPYSAAKAGLNALTKAFAREYGPNVRVNAIQCGTFRTDISKAWNLEMMQAHARDRFALQRIAEPEEIVGTAMYLAGEASSYTTGAVIRVDGGHP